MGSERVEIVLKAARKVDELRANRARMTHEIDRRIKDAEAELEALIAGNAASNSADTGSMTMQDRLLEAIRVSPTADVRYLAQALYEDQSQQAKHRIRSMLWTLKKRGRIVEKGNKYEVLN